MDLSVKCLGLAVPCDLWAEYEGTKVSKCLHARWSVGALGAMMTTQIFAKSCSARNSIVWERSLSARWALETTCVCLYRCIVHSVVYLINTPTN